MYQQKEGLGMGNVLSSLLSNIFVGFLEMKLLSTQKPYHPSFYRRYVDDTFALFSCKEDSLKFFDELNSMSCLEFTMDEEQNGKLPFLDVFVERHQNSYLTSVYRKPTFSGTYQRWDSFSPKSRKISLIEIIVHRALKICSASKLEDELEIIRHIFRESGYPTYIIDGTIKKKLARSANSPKFGPMKQPVYVKLPRKGSSSEEAAKHLCSAVHSTYGTVKLHVIFSTCRLLPSTYKDTLPKYAKSNVIYLFKCKRCESEYVGKTSRRLNDRIKEHVPKVIRSNNVNSNNDIKIATSKYNLRGRSEDALSCPSRFTMPKNISAIDLHLLENPACGKQYDESCFQIIGHARSAYELSVLESVHINTIKPILCRQKDYVYHCKLFRNFISS